MAPAGTITAKALRICVLLAGKHGVRADALLGPLGVTLAALEDAERHVPAAWCDRAWTAAPDLAGDPDFGLHAAELAVASPSHVVDYIGSLSRTPREFFESLVRFQRTLSSTSDIRLEVHGPVASLARYGEAAPQLVVFIVAQMILFVRRRKTGLPLLRATFRHPRPARTEEYERVFQCDVAFGAERNAIEFDAGLLDLELDGADPRLLAMIRGHCEKLLDALPKSAPRTDEQVRRYLIGLPPGAAPTINDVARALHTSARSLQRRLLVDGATFKGVVESARRDLAVSYLRGREHTISEVAFMTGFAEVSAFSRAFRRWEGSSPAAWRRAHAAP